MEETKKETAGKGKDWEIVANELAKNILHYGLNELRELLRDYALKCDRSMLPKEKESDEEVYLTFTDPEPEKKNLQMKFDDSQVGKDNDFVRLLFSFTGGYVQYETDKYCYRCEMEDADEIWKLLKDKGIGILSQEVGGENYRCCGHQRLRNPGHVTDEENPDETKKEPSDEDKELSEKELRESAEQEKSLEEWLEEDEGDSFYGTDEPEYTDFEISDMFDRVYAESNAQLEFADRHNYSYFMLDRPFSDDRLKFQYVELVKPLERLGEKEFDIPLVIEGHLAVDDSGKSCVRFTDMYLEDRKKRKNHTDKKSLLSVARTNKEREWLEMGDEERCDRSFEKADGELLNLGIAPMPDDMLLYEWKDCKLRVISREELSQQLQQKLEDALFCQKDAPPDLIDLDKPAEEGPATPKAEERAKAILGDYLYFHATKAKILGSQSHPELLGSRYNLMLVADDMSRAVQFVEILRESMRQPKISDAQYKLFRESDLLDNPGLVDEILGHSDNLVVIYDCQERPVYNPDNMGSSSEDRELRKKVNGYGELWERIGEAAMKENAGILIVIASRRTYTKTLRFDQIIHDIVCEHHLELRDLLPEEVSKLFIKKIEQSSFEVNDSLENDIKAYVDAVYPKSNLRGMKFVDAYFDKFVSLYMLKENEDDTLSGCIPPVKKTSAEEILAELSSYPGMDGVVNDLKKIYYMKDVLLRMNDVCHMSFEGNPGTGKTMVARKMADMLYYMGVIKKPLCIPMSVGDFRSKWIGATDEKVKAKFRSAQGGVLFIDEAYLLAEDKNFQEGIGLLIQEMEDKENPDRPLVILAGYEDRMRDLLKTNAGLNSRIKFHIQFRDYNKEELYEILKLMLNKVGFEVAKKPEKAEDDDQTKEKLDQLIRDRMSVTDFGNARAMERLAEELAAKHAEREAAKRTDASPQDVIETKRVNTYVIETEDAEALLPETDTRQITKILKTQPKVEAEFKKLKAGIAYRTSLQMAGLSVHIPAARRHMVFRGAPGTGKTTVAKQLADYLCEAKALPTCKLVTVEIQDLENGAGNMTPARNMEEFVERARGGILFMDEAYTLLDKSYCWSVIQVLLTKMEERREDTVFIFAGYPEEMDQFVGLNKGFKSRIGYNFLFESYKEDVLATMFLDKMEQAGLRFDDTEKAREKLERIMRYFSGMSDFGNGRFVDEIFDMTVNRHGENLLKKHSEAVSGAEGGEFAYSTEELTIYSVESDLPTNKDILESRGIEDDPETREKYEKRMTAIHELGHAVVLASFKESMMAGARRAGEYPVNIKVVTIRPQYPAGGWVAWEPNYAGQVNMTERFYKERLAWGMAGRAAEKLYFGSHTRGCSQDYRNAKSTAKQMIEQFAMGDLGITSPMDLVREADETASRLIVENREFIDIAVDFLVQFEEIEGSKFEEAFHIYRTEGGEALRDYLKGLKG